MKKFMLFASCAVMLAACTPKVPQAEYDALKAQKDSIEALNNAMNEVIGTVNKTMTDMAADEGLIFVDDEGKDLKDKNAVLGRMQAFRDHMAKQREELQNLKKKLSGSNWQNSELKKQIDNLTAQIEAKDAEIADLQQKLEQSNITIAQLKGQMTALTIAKEEVEADRDRIQEVAREQDLALNTGFYIIDTKSALKAAGLTEGVFRKRANYDNFDASKFTKIDIREFTQLVIDSKKPKLVTEKPEGSYTLDKNADGTTTLTITDPAAFWNASPYLIIQK